MIRFLFRRAPHARAVPPHATDPMPSRCAC